MSVVGWQLRRRPFPPLLASLLLLAGCAPATSAPTNLATGAGADVPSGMDGGSGASASADAASTADAATVQPGGTATVTVTLRYRYYADPSTCQPSTCAATIQAPATAIPWFQSTYGGQGVKCSVEVSAGGTDGSEQTVSIDCPCGSGAQCSCAVPPYTSGCAAWDPPYPR